MLHSPQTLIPSSTSTTPSAQIAPPARQAWCFIPRKPLFLRLEAPRPQSKCLPRRDRRGAPPPRNPLFLRPEAPRPQSKCLPRRDRRGAPPPANPYSFVPKHHALESNSAAGGVGVVPHRPHTLVPAGGAPTASSSPQDRAGPLRGSSADAAGTIRGNEIGLWMTADTFCQLSQSP